MSPCIFPKRDGSTDPVAHAIAETLFWAEQMKEHAAFFIMLMPGDALAGPRGQAGKFQAEFAAIGEQARTWTKEGLAAASRTTIDATRRFVDYKRDLQRKQAAGELQSLVWPTFFDHTAQEGEYFIGRLGALARVQRRLGQRLREIPAHGGASGPPPAHATAPASVERTPLH